MDNFGRYCTTFDWQLRVSKREGKRFLKSRKSANEDEVHFLRGPSQTHCIGNSKILHPLCITVVKHFPVNILPTNYSVQQLLLEGTGVRPRRKVWIFQRFCLTSQAMDECLHVWPKLESLQMRATMSAEGNLSCFELFAVPLEAIGTSRLVIEPMAITSIVQLDDGTLCHLRS